MTRSRKVEKAIKEDITFKPIGSNFADYSYDQTLEMYTNEGSDRFCPFIDHMKLAKMLAKSNVDSGMMHRDTPLSIEYSLSHPAKYDLNNKKNLHYHWVQVGFKSYQCCKYQRDLVLMDDDNWGRCQCNFKKCPVYKSHQKE